MVFKLSIYIALRRCRASLRDPVDDVVIATALAAKAELVVTGDRALLLFAEYESGRIVSVSEALKAIG
jgi:hypothetical protein